MFVRRPTTLERSYCDTSASAACPSGVEVSSTPSTSTASIARKTSLAMVGTPFVSLQRHDDADEIDAEDRLDRHGHADLACDLLRTRRGDIERVPGERLVLHHAGQERVECRLQCGAHARIV